MKQLRLMPSFRSMRTTRATAWLMRALDNPTKENQAKAAIALAWLECHLHRG